MRRLVTIPIIVAAMTVSAFVANATTVSAQQNPPKPAPLPAPARGSVPPRQQNIAQPAVKPIPLPSTAEEFNTQGEAIVTRGTTLSQTVRKMLEDARKEADIIKITCLDNKLTQIDVNVRTAETRLESLQKAVDADRRTHEFTVLTVIGQKLQVLDQEAHQCVGQSMYETGTTKVVTEIDTNMLPSETNPSMPPVITPPSLPTIPPPVSGIK